MGIFDFFNKQSKKPAGHSAETLALSEKLESLTGLKWIPYNKSRYLYTDFDTQEECETIQEILEDSLPTDKPVFFSPVKGNPHKRIELDNYLCNIRALSRGKSGILKKSETKLFTDIKSLEAASFKEPLNEALVAQVRQNVAEAQEVVQECAKDKQKLLAKSQLQNLKPPKMG